MTHEETEAAIERLRGMRTASRDFIVEVCRAFIGDCEVTGDELHYTLIELLEQADPGTHIELPVDADGEYIHIGDELISNHSKKRFVLTRLKYSRKHAWMIGGADKDDLSEYSLYAPCETRHYHRPTVEDVLRQFADVGIRIGAKHGIKAGEFTFTADEDAVAEYAAKLREVMKDDE